jgi:hypothetical protein
MRIIIKSRRALVAVTLALKAPSEAHALEWEILHLI